MAQMDFERAFSNRIADGFWAPANVELAGSALARGADPNEPLMSGKKPLARAIELTRGDFSAVPMLLRAGADWREDPKALFDFIFGGLYASMQMSVLEALESAGFDPSMEIPLEPRGAALGSGRWTTPLRLALNPKKAGEGDMKAVEKLLEMGADPNGCDSAGLGLLPEAVKAGKHGLCRLLLSAGADPCKRFKGAGGFRVEIIGATNGKYESALEAAVRSRLFDAPLLSELSAHVRVSGKEVLEEALVGMMAILHQAGGAAWLDDASEPLKDALRRVRSQEEALEIEKAARASIDSAEPRRGGRKSL